jgi:Ribonuclease G/E
LRAGEPGNRANAKEEEQQSVMDLEKRINRRIVILAKESAHLEEYEISGQTPN